MIKGLVAKSATLPCQSLTHNVESPATLATIFKGGSSFDQNNYKYDKVIDEGVVVMTLATRCDSIVECFDRIDENGCDNTDPYSITLIGTYFTLLVHFNGPNSKFLLLSPKGQKILKSNNGVYSVLLKMSEKKSI